MGRTNRRLAILLAEISDMASYVQIQTNLSGASLVRRPLKASLDRSRKRNCSTLWFGCRWRIYRKPNFEDTTRWWFRPQFIVVFRKVAKGTYSFPSSFFCNLKENYNTGDIPSPYCLVSPLPRVVAMWRYCSGGDLILSGRSGLTLLIHAIKDRYMGMVKAWLRHC